MLQKSNADFPSVQNVIGRFTIFIQSERLELSESSRAMRPSGFWRIALIYLRRISDGGHRSNGGSVGLLSESDKQIILSLCSAVTDGRRHAVKSKLLSESLHHDAYSPIKL